jgi:serine/threonine-protein kinase RsbW
VESNGIKKITLRLPGELDMLGVVDKVIEGITSNMAFEEDDRDAVAISVIEACSNAIQHGRASETPDAELDVVFHVYDEQLVILVHDNGPGFEPDLDATSAPDLLSPRGRGIFIMRSMMDDVVFDFSNGTMVKLTKKVSKAEVEDASC